MRVQSPNSCAQGRRKREVSVQSEQRHQGIKFQMNRSSEIKVNETRSLYYDNPTAQERRKEFKLFLIHQLHPLATLNL